MDAPIPRRFRDLWLQGMRIPRMPPTPPIIQWAIVAAIMGYILVVWVAVGSPPS